MDTATEVRFDRIRAALGALAADRTVPRVERLMRFVRLLMEEVRIDRLAYARWLRGTLVIDFRRDHWSSTLVIVADDGRAFRDLFSCSLPFVAFDAITSFVGSRPAPLGSAFVLVSDDLVSVSVLEEVDLVDDDVEEIAVLWDPDATLIQPPHPDVLATLVSNAALAHG